jgi:hypothetical protein
MSFRSILLNRPVYVPLLCSGFLTEIFRAFLASALQKIGQTQFIVRGFIAFNIILWILQITVSLLNFLQSFVTLSFCGRNTVPKHFVLTPCNGAGSHTWNILSPVPDGTLPTVSSLKFHQQDLKRCTELWAHVVKIYTVVVFDASI